MISIKSLETYKENEDVYVHWTQVKNLRFVKNLTIDFTGGIDDEFPSCKPEFISGIVENYKPKNIIITQKQKTENYNCNVITLIKRIDGRPTYDKVNFFGWEDYRTRMHEALYKQKETEKEFITRIPYELTNSGIIFQAKKNEWIDNRLLRNNRYLSNSNYNSIIYNYNYYALSCIEKGYIPQPLHIVIKEVVK